jgi:chloride channel protein, CIC family
MWTISLPRQVRRLLVNSKQLAIVEACVIGLLSGLAAVLLKQGVGWVGGWRIAISHHLPTWFILPIIGLVGGFLSGWVVQQFAPEAAGSGIPQVKAALANVPIALNLRVAIAKLVAVILSLGAGLNLGRQGPTVQVGAALAGQLSRWIPTSPEYRRQLIAAGAAAGLAAGFNAPIAGVLFVVEEFLQDFSGLTLGTAILASFIGAVVSRLLGGQGLNLNLDKTQFQASFSLEDVPFFLLLGLLAGVLGALFSRGIFVSLNFNRQVLKLSLPWRVGLAGLISGIVAAMLPSTFLDNTGLQEQLSMGGEIWQVTLLAFVVKFILTLVAYGSGAPGGIFVPSLILGSALGGLVGIIAHGWEFLAWGLQPQDGITDTATYALAGMGAFFSAVTRGPITAIVIVFEMTADFNLVLPLMIGSVVAYLVSYQIAGRSFYNDLLAWNGIHLDKDPNAVEGVWAGLLAADLMQRQVETLPIDLTLSEAKQAFSRSHHRGFPVMQDGRLVGIVTQTDLADPSRRAMGSAEITLAEIMTPQPVTVQPTDSLTHVLYLLHRFKLSRLPVVEDQKLVGIITRADIIRAEADHISGKTEQSSPGNSSYAVYQTRSPSTGKGRLLVPLCNPRTAPALLRLAAAIARDRQYEIECLQIITVPRGQSPAETPVQTTASRRLLKQAEKLGRTWQIPVHTQIRVANNTAQAILETVEARHIDLVLMGWRGSTTAPDRFFGSLVETVIQEATCEVVLVKLGENEQFRNVQFNHWLVPIAGGPNSQQALQLLPAFASLSKSPDVRICQVFESEPSSADTQLLLDAVQNLSKQLHCPIMARPVCQSSVPEAVTRLAWREHCDVIMLGASREGILQQAIKGNIPEAIARDSNRTVILVRDAIPAQD